MHLGRRQIYESKVEIYSNYLTTGRGHTPPVCSAA